MLYDDSQSPDERFVATLMPLPADSDYAKEQGHISIIAMKKNFAIEYNTLDHPALLRDQHIERWCRGSSFPSLHAFYSASEELKMMEVLRRTGRSASAEAQPPKGSTAELMLREATSEVVFSGPEYLYREPRCVTRCAKMLLGKWVVDVSHVPTRSKPESFATKLPTSFSKKLSKARARRDCEAAMKDILKAWREEHTANKSKKSKAKHDESSSSHKSSKPTAIGLHEEAQEEDRGDSGKFVDAHFFLGHRSSLYPTGTAPDTHVPEPRDLVSLCSLFPDVELFPQECASNCVSAADDSAVVQQQEQFVIPVCRSTHLVAAACAVASMKNGFEFLRELFVTPQLGDEEEQGEADAAAKPYDDRHTKEAEGGEGLTPTEFLRRYGFIGVLLYINACWEWVIIDDLVPTDATGASPLMMHLVSRGHMESLQSMFGPFSKDAAVRGRLGARVSTRVPTPLDGRDDPSALWPHMLQKAVAKWFGAYDAVDGGSPRSAMEMLTGGSVSSLRPLEEDSMAAFDVFDDETSGRLCLVYCTRELFVGLGASSVCKGVLAPQQSSRKSEAGGRAFDSNPRTDKKSSNGNNTLSRRERPIVDEETDTFKCAPSRGGKEGSAVWLPRHLPLILSRCFTSEDKATPVVRLESPWGMLGPDGSSTVDLEWSEFVTICDHCDLCTLPDASQVYAEAYGVSASNVARSFSFALRAPLRAPITVCVRQADPRSHFDLPYEVRRRLPLVGMSMSITEVTSKSLVYQSNEPVVALENSVDLRLLPGEYTVTLEFDEAPSVPFLLRVCASTLVTVKLWPTGLHPDVSGATTARISNTPVNGGGRRDRDAAASERLKRLLKARQSQVVTDGRNDEEEQEARRSELLSPSARAAEVLAKKVFDEVDILEKGTLDLRAAERAAAEFFFAHTKEGRALRDALITQATNGGGAVAKEAFAPLMSNHFKDHFAN